MDPDLRGQSLQNVQTPVCMCVCGGGEWGRINEVYEMDRCTTTTPCTNVHI